MNRPVYPLALPGVIGYVGERIHALDLWLGCARAERVPPTAAPDTRPPRPVRVTAVGREIQHYLPANAATDSALLDVGNAVAELDAWSLIATRIEIGLNHEPTVYINRAPTPEHLARVARGLHTARLAGGRTVGRCMAHGVWLEWEVVS